MPELRVVVADGEARAASFRIPDHARPSESVVLAGGEEGVAVDAVRLILHLAEGRVRERTYRALTEAGRRYRVEAVPLQVRIRRAHHERELAFASARSDVVDP